MTTKTLIQWGGLSALIAGGIAIAGEIALYITVGNLPYSQGGVTATWLVLTAIMIVSTMLSMLGLIAFYARQVKETGKFGTVAFILSVVGTMMLFGHQWTGPFVIPVLAAETPDFLDILVTDTTTILAGGLLLSVFLMAIGWFLFGLASLRAKIFPVVASWLIMIGALLIFVLSLIDFDLDKLVFNIGLVWMGWWLWMEKASRT